MPDFQQFAAKCEISASICRRTADEYKAKVGDSDKWEAQAWKVWLGLGEQMEHAERHARLLQQILNYVEKDPTVFDKRRTYADGQDEVKAHVRSLLVSQTEEK